MNKQKILLIDRDGTLIEEPPDHQIDRLDKLALMPHVITALLQLKQAGFLFIIVSNQDGLGTDRFPITHFNGPHQLMLQLFKSQGVPFEAVLICPHQDQDGCDCRKPKVGLVQDYLINQTLDKNHSYVIGDRETDMQFAERLGVEGIRIGHAQTPTWVEVTRHILGKSRSANRVRTTKETSICAQVNLDEKDTILINTGIPFFDHMLEQLAKHGGFSLTLSADGDLEVDDHHTVEDTAIVLGETIREALGHKGGIGRYGFLLPMDESLAHIALDLCGRSYFNFNGRFHRESIGGLSTELVPHFFRSLAEGLKATLHIKVAGENTHHMLEAIFKGVGRTLRQATERNGSSLPSTKGAL